MQPGPQKRRRPRRHVAIAAEPLRHAASPCISRVECHKLLGIRAPLHGTLRSHALRGERRCRSCPILRSVTRTSGRVASLLLGAAGRVALALLGATGRVALALLGATGRVASALLGATGRVALLRHSLCSQGRNQRRAQRRRRSRFCVLVCAYGEANASACSQPVGPKQEITIASGPRSAIAEAGTECA